MTTIPNYEKMTLAAAKKELKSRNIKFFSGADKDALIGLLIDDDTAKAKAEAEKSEGLTAQSIEELKAQLEAEYNEKLTIAKENMEKQVEEASHAGSGPIPQTVLKSRREALALQRVSVINNNPVQNEWDGELIRIGNDVLDGAAHFVPNSPTVITHLPKILVDYLDNPETTCTIFRQEKGKGGTPIHVPERIKKYTVIRHAPLTQEELSALAENQVKRGLDG